MDMNLVLLLTMGCLASALLIQLSEALPIVVTRRRIKR